MKRNKDLFFFLRAVKEIIEEEIKTTKIVVKSKPKKS